MEFLGKPLPTMAELKQWKQELQHRKERLRQQKQDVEYRLANLYAEECELNACTLMRRHRDGDYVSLQACD
jgi:predicted nuclease with TOPRIM domain